MAEVVREYIDFGVVLLVFGLGLIALAILAFQAFCIVWSPFAAVMCGRVARKRRLNILRYSIIGAIYSVLLFVPWMYIMQRMRHEHNTTEEFTFDYNLLYVMWGFWIFDIAAGVIFMMFWVAGADPIPAGWSWNYLSREYLVWLMQGAIPLTGALLWIISRKGTAGRLAAESEETRNVGDDELANLLDIRPFAYFSANIIAVPVTFLISVFWVIPLIW